jgi:hypothetical protein
MKLARAGLRHSSARSAPRRLPRRGASAVQHNPCRTALPALWPNLRRNFALKMSRCRTAAERDARSRRELQGRGHPCCEGLRRGPLCGTKEPPYRFSPSSAPMSRRKAMALAFIYPVLPPSGRRQDRKTLKSLRGKRSQLGEGFDERRLVFGKIGPPSAKFPRANAKVPLRRSVERARDFASAPGPCRVLRRRPRREAGRRTPCPQGARRGPGSRWHLGEQLRRSSARRVLGEGKMLGRNALVRLFFGGWVFRQSVV